MNRFKTELTNLLNCYHYCVYLKRETLYNCLCCPWFFFYQPYPDLIGIPDLEILLTWPTEAASSAFQMYSCKN